MLTTDDVDVITTGVAEGLKPVFAQLEARIKHLEAAASRLAPLEAKLRELETKAAAGCEWRGVYQTDVKYSPGELVTKSGSLWLAVRETSAIPGTDDSGWTLVVKAGAFGVRQGAA